MRRGSDEPEVMMVTNSLRFSTFNLRKILEENKQQNTSACSVINSRQNNHLLDQINHLRHTTYKRIEDSFHQKSSAILAKSPIKVNESSVADDPYTAANPRGSGISIYNKNRNVHDSGLPTPIDEE